MKKTIALFLILSAFGCQKETPDFTRFVDPFIGTDGHGHTFPGATVPFGMVQLSPDTRKDSWDGCSGYHYSDSTILGFSHTHLSGTGVGDYGDIRLMPMTRELHLLPGTEDSPDSGYRSSFHHSGETAKPGYYHVYLKDYGIDAELTATRRCGLHRYTFPEKEPAFVVIDLFESVTTDILISSGAEINNDREISGFRRTKGWAEDQVVYFYAIFSEPFSEAGIARAGMPDPGLQSAEGNNLQVFVSFPERDWHTLHVKVGISAVSRKGARNNLEKEISHWDFDQVAKKASEEWNTELSRVEISSGDEDDRFKFYTALYHSYIAPNTFSDADGSYRGHDGQIHQAGDREIYTVFSLWDTYRALHPLMTVLQPNRTDEFIHTMTDIFEKGGLLPVWELAGNETFCMIGYHSVPVIVDAIMKGYRGFDLELAYEGMKHSAGQDHFGLDSYREHGYIPADREGESVSKTLEYAYDDWCIAQMAKFLGREKDYRYYLERAQYYKNLVDPETGFIRGKRNSSFVQPFDPAEVNFMLTEANTWQYTFYAPHDLGGMMDLMGGPQAFAGKLDELFSTSSDLTGREQADITGLIGQYAHGNEPSHHAAYLYNYCGQPHKTQKIARQIMDGLYGAEPDGLCGNEDCGQMSAWFVWSALGFYPVCPGDNQYIIGSPLFKEAVIHLPGGEAFTVNALNNSRENIYVQSVRLNGDPVEKTFLTHEELMGGGELVFEMGPRPSDWGTRTDEWPPSRITEHMITPVPFFIAPGKTFRDQIEVGIGHAWPEAELFYAYGDVTPGRDSKRFKDTLINKESFSISAVAVMDPYPQSMTARASFKKMHNPWGVTLKNPYNSQYSGGGELGLVDGETGGVNFRTGGWQGYQGVDFEVVIDMGKRQAVSAVTARFLEDQNAWIFLPMEVEIGISNKPYDFRVISLIHNPVSEAHPPAIREFRGEVSQSMARYIKVRAKNIGDCPDWHKGAGGQAWLFIDEIEVE